MKTYMGTLVPAMKPTTEFFTCQRCGIRKTYSGTRKRPQRCLDCRGTLHGLAQSIPPAYTEHIGAQLLAHIDSERAA